MKFLVICLIKLYQIAVSPLVILIPGGGCRFYPTCSQYTERVIRKYGAVKGAYLGIKRLIDCNPWS